MIEIALAFFLGANREGLPPDAWRCRNQVEVWCAADGCAAANPDEFTPMDISADARGALSVCAYSGCWSGKAKVARAGGRWLFAGDAFAFSTSQGGETADVTLVIVARDGVGFVRAGGLATPVLCARATGD
ncbi:MAG TPA: hypothetical protein DDZ68_16035 [Parvularcula sp.]|nr:hypothetical protein [Parvularcula sp.]HBS31241.1 hypothetical protein [Parvularcula sp.]HBS34729.1 hypothetical protein [Parvularcula sp.]